MLVALSVQAATFLHGPAAVPSRYSRRCRSPYSCEAAVGSSSNAISEALPHVTAGTLIAEDVEYAGLGLTLSGRDAYSAAACAWRDELPKRLRGLRLTSKTVLPVDARRRMSARWSYEFEAPVPPQVLPAQRTRVLAAKLPTSGMVSVRATVVCELLLDADGRVRRHTEQLVSDPFDAANSIAHFELLNARATALLPTPLAASPLRTPIAYWRALRGMMRIELEEARRRAQTDELSVLEGAAGVTDDEFEGEFRWFIARALLTGALPAAAAWGVAKLAAQVTGGGAGSG